MENEPFMLLVGVKKAPGSGATIGYFLPSEGLPTGWSAAAKPLLMNAHWAK